jgi:capsular polysaccharide biosynthesis protein
MGMHGAGLMNVIFAPRGVIMVELKTMYAYSLNLFSIATESRMGIHTQVGLAMWYWYLSLRVFY